MTRTTEPQKCSLDSLSELISAFKYPAGAHMDKSISVCFLQSTWGIKLWLFCFLQMYAKCDTGAGDDPGQEPWPHATVHHADHRHTAQTGKLLMQLISNQECSNDHTTSSLSVVSFFLHPLSLC